MKLYNWMVQYTPQTIWIEKKGLLVWLSMVAGLLGGGVYLFALFFGLKFTMLIGWLIVLLLKGGLHLFHTEHPVRLWRMLLNIKSSWISRGLIFTFGFVLFGLVNILISTLLPEFDVIILIFRILSGICAFGVLLYSGFTLNFIRSIPFWNVAVLPFLFMLWGLILGTGLLPIIEYQLVPISQILNTNLWLFISMLLLLVLYICTESYRGESDRKSLMYLASGVNIYILSLAFLFTMVSLIMCALMLTGLISVQYINMLILFIFDLLSVLGLSYLIMKAGIYNSVLPPRICEIYRLQ